MSFDRDVIVEFLTGDGSDSVITKGTSDLVSKLGRDAKEDVISLKGPAGVEHVSADQMSKLRTGIQSSDGDFRLYLRGHGIWQVKTLGGWSPQQVAQLLLQADLTKVDLISVTGCNLARNVDFGDETKRVTPVHKKSIGAARDVLLKTSVDSFAGELHLRLKSLKCKLYGRTYYVNVVGSQHETGQMSLLYDKHGSGIKVTSAEASGGEQHSRPFSKILFYWDGDQQKWKWVDY